MKKIILRIDGKEIQAQIEEGELAKLEEKKDKGARPPRAEFKKTYWLADSDNVARETEEMFVEDDYFRYYSGNYFLTREEAQKRKEYNEAIARINKYVIENGMWLEPNWANGNQLKHQLNCDFLTGKWERSTARYLSCFSNLPYFREKTHIEKVIKDCADDLEIIKNYHLKK